MDQIPYYIEHSISYENGDYDTYIWSDLELTFLEWFEHLRSLFNFVEYRFRVSTTGAEIFDTVVIRNLLPEWTHVKIEDAAIDYAYKIFEQFAASTKNFETGNISRDLKVPQKLSIQNYDSIWIYKPFSLDDALISNASEMTLSKFTISDTNRFIRSWMKLSNPRLKKAVVYPKEDMDNVKLWKGIQHLVLPENMEREWDGGENIEGGIDIRNKKGTLATLTISLYSTINMYVWS